MILNYQVLRIASNYENFHKSLVQCFDKGAFSELSLDMLVFSMLKDLNERQEEYSVIDSEAFVQQGLRKLADFASLIFKSFPKTDLKPILEYLLDRMRCHNSFHEAILLSSILEQMFQWKSLEISMLNNEQLSSLCGGMWLQLEVQQQINEFMLTKRTSKALINTFWEHKDYHKQTGDVIKLSTAFKIMVHLAQ